MLDNEKLTIGAARYLFAIILVCCLAFIFSRFDNDSGFSINLDSNIKDLSPQITEGKALSAAVDHIAAAIESRLTLLLLAKETDLTPAAQQLSDALSAVEGVSASVNDSALPADFLQTLVEYRFNFLTEEQRLQLNEKSQAELVETAIARLYQLDGSQGLLSIGRDPLGWFTEYVLSQGGALVEPENTAQREFQFVAINASLDRSGMDVETQGQLIAKIATLESAVMQQYPGIQILHSGVLFIAAETTKQAKKDVERISIISMIAVVGLLLLAFYSLKLLLLPAVSILVGIGFALVATHFIYGSIHVLTIVFGASLIGVVIDYSLHYFYHQTIDRSQSRSHLIRAMQLSLISSVIGYAALGLSDLVSLQKVAVFSCAGLIAAWITVVALAAKLRPASTRINPRFLPPLVEKISLGAAWLGRWNKIYVAGVVLIGAALLVGGIKGNDHPSGYFKLSDQLLAEETEVARYTQLIEPGRYFIVRGEDVDALYANLEALYAEIPDAPFLSILDWLPSPTVQRENYLLQNKLYGDAGVAKQFMSTLGMASSSIDDLLKEYQALKSRTLLPTAIFEGHTAHLPPLMFAQNGQLYSFVLLTKSEQLNELDLSSINIAGVDYFDTAGMSERALKSQRLSALGLLGVAFVLIGLLLLIRYRRLSALWMLFIPMSATIITLGIFAALGIGVTLFHTMALFLVLGLGMDYVIFVSELEQHQSITLQAVFLSAITSLLSFGLLSVSSMPAVSAFGLAILIGNSVNLIGSMLYAHRKSVSLRYSKLIKFRDST